MKTKKVEEKFTKTLQDNLCRLRHAAGLSQYGIAAFLNINRSTYSYYECGKTRPSFQTILNLSRLYDVSIEILLTVPRTCSDTHLYLKAGLKTNFLIPAYKINSALTPRAWQGARRT